MVSASSAASFHATSIRSCSQPATKKALMNGAAASVKTKKSLVKAAAFRPSSPGIRNQPRTQSSNPVLPHFGALGLGTPNCTAMVAAPSAPAATPSQAFTGSSSRGQASLPGALPRGGGVMGGASDGGSNRGSVVVARGTSDGGVSGGSGVDARASRATRSRLGRLIERPPRGATFFQRRAR